MTGKGFLSSNSTSIYLPVELVQQIQSFESANQGHNIDGFRLSVYQENGATDKEYFKCAGVDKSMNPDEFGANPIELKGRYPFNFIKIYLSKALADSMIVKLKLSGLDGFSLIPYISGTKSVIGVKGINPNGDELINLGKFEVDPCPPNCDKD